MHFWGDEWFKKYGPQLYEAINWITQNLVKYRIKIMTKEKFGEMRTDMIEFWDGGLYSLIFKNKYYIGPIKYYKPKFLNSIIEFIHKTIYWFDHRMIPYRKTKYGWLQGGIAEFNQFIGLTKPVHWFQRRMFNKTFQLACKKWPDIQTELLLDVVACTKGIIKPCKWGDIDGDKLYKKWWKQL